MLETEESLGEPSHTFMDNAFKSCEVISQPDFHFLRVIIYIRITLKRRLETAAAATVHNIINRSNPLAFRPVPGFNVSLYEVADMLGRVRKRNAGLFRLRLQNDLSSCPSLGSYSSPVALKRSERVLRDR